MAAYRQKKHRHFKQQKEINTFYPEENLSEYLDTAIDPSIEIDTLSNLVTYQSEDTQVDVSEFSEFDSSSDLSIDSEYYSHTFPADSFSDNEPFHQQSTNLIETNCREKLQKWTVDHRSHLTVETVEDLLKVLRVENIPNLPKSAVTLLHTKSNKNIKLMNSAKNTIGYFMFLGIEQGLNDVITEDYTDNVICLLFNINGLPLFNGSNQQFWAILGLILHNEYNSQPFIIAVYSGDFKPQSIDVFLKDFVSEAKNLVLNGVTIGQVTFKVDVVGFYCDTLARSFIKKCKGHGGYYACERCETSGTTINKKRVENISEFYTQRVSKKKITLVIHLPS
ncbi:uncharacterized protein LOC136073289 [Hydra vulgaris]|uniref:uncharacterized protein LOC136073289 n=1 Tax=Hydra vulgaris TaxID=6087 RepID=UPI0032E9D1E9